MTAAIQLDTSPERAPRRVPQIRVCTLCGGVQPVTVTALARVVPGEVKAVICGHCRRVGEDLVAALGLPPDAEAAR